MKKSGFTFAVVDEEGSARSDIWKVKATKNGDLLIGNSSMAEFKITIHAPRDGMWGCHVAFDANRIPAGFPVGRRALNRWERTATADGKANAVFSVNFPASFLADPYKPKNTVDVALPVPAGGTVAEFLVMFSPQPIALTNWPADTVLCRALQLASGEFVHFIRWECLFPDDFAISRVMHLYPEKRIDSLDLNPNARLTIHLDPDENVCVKAVEVGGSRFREMLKARWGFGQD
jgi:hypothetical protein